MLIAMSSCIKGSRCRERELVLAPRPSICHASMSLNRANPRHILYNIVGFHRADLTQILVPAAVVRSVSPTHRQLQYLVLYTDAATPYPVRWFPWFATNRRGKMQTEKLQTPSMVYPIPPPLTCPEMQKCHRSPLPFTSLLARILPNAPKQMKRDLIAQYLPRCFLSA